MTERFPPDCSSVSGRFRNTTFICFGPSAASLALRAHSRGLRPPVLVLRLLRWRSALTPGACAPLFWSFGCFAGAPRLGSPRSTAPLRCALATGLLPCLAPSTAPLRCAPRVTSLDYSAALRARDPGCRPVWLLRLLRCRSAPRVTSLDYSAPLRCALATGLSPCLAPSAAPLALRASGHLARLLRCAARSRPGWRPVWLLRLLRCRYAPRVFPLDCSASLRARAAGCRPDCSFGCFAVLQRARACEISQATGLCYAGGRSGARFFLPAPSISDLSVKELASA